MAHADVLSGYLHKLVALLVVGQELLGDVHHGSADEGRLRDVHLRCASSRAERQRLSHRGHFEG